jgi:hypothetical protein
MSGRLNRRRILAGAAAVGGAGVLASYAPAAQAKSDDDKHAAQIVGTWFITVTPADKTVEQFNVLVNFTADGGSVATTSNDFAPGSRSSVGFGSWVRTSRNTFRLHGMGFAIDAAGNSAGIAHVRENATIDARTDAYHGVTTVTLEVGGQVVFSAASTADGKRIVA